MVLTKERKGNLIEKYRLHAADTGSAEVQAALLTERINYLSEHLKSHAKDHNSRVGLLRLVDQRRRLLNYLKDAEAERYKNLIERLGMRK